MNALGSFHGSIRRMTDLVGLPDVTVAPNDWWMPYGKPVRTNNGWDGKPAAEAQLDRVDGFVEPELRRQLLDWWLACKSRPKTPHWDVASSCTIEGKEGLLVVEAKAHSKELSRNGKRKPSSENGRKSHAQSGSAIEQANVGLRRVTGGTWALSRDRRYQLANRFAWSWKLASLGVPVVLLYIGFLNAEDMARDGALFRSESDWARTLTDHARGVADDCCWGRRLEVNGTPLRPLIRAIDVPFTPNL